MAKGDSGSFSWNEAEPGESTAKDGLPTEVADALPTVRTARSSDSEETYRDIPKPTGVDPFSLTLDDAGATRLELEQTLPPIRAPSMRLVAPSLPEPPPARSPEAPRASPSSRAPSPSEAMPTEPELEPPPISARRRPPKVSATAILAIVVGLLLCLAVLLIWYGGDSNTVVADPAPHTR